MRLKTPAEITPRPQLAEQFPPEVTAGKIHELLEATRVTKGGQTIPGNRAREAGLNSPENCQATAKPKISGF